MISKESEISLNACFDDARKKRHEYVTVENLLLCLLDNSSAVEVLKALSPESINVVEDLRKDLETFIADNAAKVTGDDKVESVPSLGFQRVIQRAIMHVHSPVTDVKKEVMGNNLLYAVFGERDSHAVYFLHKYDITRLDVQNYIMYSIRKDGKPEVSPETRPQDKEEIKISSFQFYMKLKDGAVDPRYAKLALKFKALILEEFPNIHSGTSMTLFDFLSSDKVAVVSSVAEDKVTLHKN